MKPKVIIYGGSGGIGSLTAQMLHNRGYDLHLVGRNDEKLSGIAGKYAAGYTVGDVTDSNTFVEVAENSGNEIAGVVYAVGSINLGSIQRLTEKDYLNDFHINALGAVQAVKASLPALRKFGATASIVLFSSVAANQGFKLHSSMGMAKGAVNGLAISLAAELAPKIRVNAIAPSLTRTPLSERLVKNDQSAEVIAGLHAIPRLGLPEDIAAMTAFLISDESGWVTGQVIGVDGGRSTVRNKG